MLQIQTDERKYRYCESTEIFTTCFVMKLFEDTFIAKNFHGFQLQLKSSS